MKCEDRVKEFAFAIGVTLAIIGLTAMLVLLFEIWKIA